jgi:hypothetical protein
MQTSPERSGGQPAQYAFASFHALPCGCVTGVYRTTPWDSRLSHSRLTAHIATLNNTRSVRSLASA